MVHNMIDFSLDNCLDFYFARVFPYLFHPSNPCIAVARTNTFEALHE